MLATAGLLTAPGTALAQSFPVELRWSGAPSAHAGAAFGYTATVTNKGDADLTVFLQEEGGSVETVVSVIPTQGTCENHVTFRMCRLVAPGMAAMARSGATL